MLDALLQKNRNQKLKKALLNDDVRSLSQALRAGAEPNLLISQSSGPPRLASRHALANGQVECLRLLLSAGGQLESDSPSADSPLVEAIHAPSQALALLSILLDAGLDPNEKQGQAFFACQALADENLVALLTNRLMQYGGDINCIDGQGMTPLSLALLDERQTLVGILISSGAQLPPQLNDLHCSEELKTFARRKAEDLRIRQLLQQR